ncbi:MAG: 50S ribosomal protein L18 [Planctomycetes bacterium]|nr:50S ribosomal protein L18 [Planctomycetota bacterium]
MKAIIKKRLRHQRRKRHVRRKLTGTPDRPRLTVFRSHRYIYAQIVDDIAGRTLVAASSREPTVREELGPNGGNKLVARGVGTRLAVKAITAGIKQVVFDRNGYAYHGRVRELAEAAREGGLKF